jgi:hypothetical protein
MSICMVIRVLLEICDSLCWLWPLESAWCHKWIFTVTRCVFSARALVRWASAAGCDLMVLDFITAWFHHRNKKSTCFIYEILVGGFKHELYLPFHLNGMGCHPSHWRTHIFQDCQNHQPVFHILRFKLSPPPKKKLKLVGGLEHFYFSIYWECHHPNWLSCFSDG